MSEVIDQLSLVYFVACGISRLARYNVTAEALSEKTGKVTYFEGTPIPTSVILVLLLSFSRRWGGSATRYRSAHSRSEAASIRWS